MVIFSVQIQSWYNQNKRDLPWRNTKDPYKIWLSEIILQQTRVDQGMSYYKKFLREFPSVIDLANASEQKVLNLWQGLGYYSRARNLHESAKQVVDKHQGVFPSSYDGLRKLKGVGDYTAAAIASFAYGESKAVVDGNVYRVLSRYLDDPTPIDSNEGKKNFAIAAAELLDHESPANHNQAIMELGALVCLPRKPLCSTCPVKDSCASFAAGTMLNLPVKKNKILVKKVYVDYFVIRDLKKRFLLKKRTGNTIWKNMYDFPSLEGGQISDDKQRIGFLSSIDVSPLRGDIFKIITIQHKLTHREITANFWLSEVENLSDTDSYIVTDISALNDIPLPRLVDKFFEENRSLFV